MYCCHAIFGKICSTSSSLTPSLKTASTSITTTPSTSPPNKFDNATKPNTTSDDFPNQNASQGNEQTAQSEGKRRGKIIGGTIGGVAAFILVGAVASKALSGWLPYVIATIVSTCCVSDTSATDVWVWASGLWFRDSYWVHCSKANLQRKQRTT